MEQIIGEDNYSNRKWSTNWNYGALIQFGGRILGEAEKEGGMCGCSATDAGCDPVNDKWWQSCVYLTCAPNSLLLKRLKCCESVYGRGQSWTQASLTAPGKPKHDFLDSVLKINLLGPAGSSHLSMTLPVRDFFLASFKIKPARQLPGVQGRSQNAEQT